MNNIGYDLSSCYVSTSLLFSSYLYFVDINYCVLIFGIDFPEQLFFFTHNFHTGHKRVLYWLSASEKKKKKTSRNKYQYTCLNLRGKSNTGKTLPRAGKNEEKDECLCIGLSTRFAGLQGGSYSVYFCAVFCLHRRKLDLVMSSTVPVKIIISHFTVKINFKGAMKINFKGAEQLDFYFNTEVARVIL